MQGSEGGGIDLGRPQRVPLAALPTNPPPLRGDNPLEAQSQSSTLLGSSRPGIGQSADIGDSEGVSLSVVKGTAEGSASGVVMSTAQLGATAPSTGTTQHSFLHSSICSSPCSFMLHRIRSQLRHIYAQQAVSALVYLRQPKLIQSNF